jgi:hypothetical protein
MAAGRIIQVNVRIANNQTLIVNAVEGENVPQFRERLFIAALANSIRQSFSKTLNDTIPSLDATKRDQLEEITEKMFQAFVSAAYHGRTANPHLRDLFLGIHTSDTHVFIQNFLAENPILQAFKNQFPAFGTKVENLLSDFLIATNLPTAPQIGDACITLSTGISIKDYLPETLSRPQSINDYTIAQSSTVRFMWQSALNEARLIHQQNEFKKTGELNLSLYLVPNTRQEEYFQKMLAYIPLDKPLRLVMPSWGDFRGLAFPFITHAMAIGHLESLQITKTKKLDNVDLQVLVTVLQVKPTIKALELAFIENPSTYKNPSDYLTNISALFDLPELTTLTLSYLRPLGNEAASAIAKKLERNSTLTSLTLCKTNMTSEGFCALGAALGSNTTLRRLTIEEETLDSKALPFFAQAVQKNQSLRELNLSICANPLRLDSGVINALKMLLNNNKNLVSLGASLDNANEIQSLLKRNRDATKAEEKTSTGGMFATKAPAEIKVNSVQTYIDLLLVSQPESDERGRLRKTSSFSQ